MKPAKNPSLIIIHVLGLTAVILLSLSLIFYNLFHNSNNQRLSVKALLNPAVWYKLLTYRHQSGVSCQNIVPYSLPSWLDPSEYQVLAPIVNSQELLVTKKDNSAWSIYRTNTPEKSLETLAQDIYFPNNSLILSYEPVIQKFMYPDCTDNLCYVYEQDLITGDKSKIPAFSAADKLPSTHIRDVFFDETRHLISYGTSQSFDSPRVVINTRSELIQTINETPSYNRHLEFKGYLPKSGLLVYYDPVNQLTYFYLGDGIGFYRQSCLN